MRLGPDMELLAMHNAVYMPMIDTAEVVGSRYSISRERCDEYALRSQQRTAAAQAAGKFADEIIPVTARMQVKTRRPAKSPCMRSRWTRTKATGRRRRSKASPSWSLCAGRRRSSQQATRASCPTAPRSAC
jgi:acetyl-CoA C-acetyltransferase